MRAKLWVLLATRTPVLAEPWSVGMGADLAIIVRELGATFLSAIRLPTGYAERPEDLDGDFTTVSVDVAFDVLALVAAGFA
ncbi:MAG: hypothetical protein ACREFQ_22990 [Stellaceae bacterium]